MIHTSQRLPVFVHVISPDVLFIPLPLSHVRRMRLRRNIGNSALIVQRTLGSSCFYLSSYIWLTSTSFWLLKIASKCKCFLLPSLLPVWTTHHSHLDCCICFLTASHQPAWNPLVTSCRRVKSGVLRASNLVLLGPHLLLFAPFPALSHWHWSSVFLEHILYSSALGLLFWNVLPLITNGKAFPDHPM